jgi:carbon storage regulator CsrA
MLILTRRLAETLVIGDSVTVLDIKGGRVRIGVNARREIGRRMPDSGP